MNTTPNGSVRSIFDVLEQEEIALSGRPLTDRTILSEEKGRSGQAAEEQRNRRDADVRLSATPDPDQESPEVERRKAFYCALNKRKRAALCCSGGGIRSATFCLGVVQALAEFDITKPRAKPDEPKAETPGAASSRGDEKAPATADAKNDGSAKFKSDTPAQNSFLAQFDFLSTVSGGGYFGSWLSAWQHRSGFEKVHRGLTSRPEGPDIEPPEISWLRAYSNYLTPKAGIGSADTWTGVAIYFRNLVLNWLVIVPAVCMVLIVLMVIATSAIWIARDAGNGILLCIALFAGIASLIGWQSFVTRHRPTRRGATSTETATSSLNIDQTTFLWRGLVWSLLAAYFITTFFTSRFAVGIVDELIASYSKYGFVLATTLAAIPIFAVGWVLRRPVKADFGDFVRWVGSGLVYGALVGAGACLFIELKPYPTDTVPLADLAQLFESAYHDEAAAWIVNIYVRNLLIPIIFGVPWVLMAQLAAEMVFVGLTSYQRSSDWDREWLGRAAGWVAAIAVIWIIVATLSIGAGYLVRFYIEKWWPYISSAGGITGIATALLGKSASTAFSAKKQDGGLMPKLSEIGLHLVGPLFAAILVVMLSIGLDEILFKDSFVKVTILNTFHPMTMLGLLLAAFVVLYAVGCIASRTININRFSMHAVYRNRLMRAYLGASRAKRDPDRFTGFDVTDNVRMHQLWPEPTAPADRSRYRLLHVVNMALNVVSTKRLAWQQRKAEPFTVSPLHSGNVFLGYRDSKFYGDDTDPLGISLSTAMAISGAAASPNMGYHSSPSVTLLLTLLNVRLGWWLGNPGPAGESVYTLDGPKLALAPLVKELFGLTDDDYRYVYLSDGGHFENLGLYEMVRRRCRFILVIDAGSDAEFKFEDLGNAVRKIYIDLGIRITFKDLQILTNETEARPKETSDGKPMPYYSIGTIDYKTADGIDDSDPDCGNGTILYIKPAYHGDEGAGVRSYKAAHPEFPHESTGDQFFTESQFESYRSLGADITSAVLNRPDAPIHTIVSDLAARQRSAAQE